MKQFDYKYNLKDRMFGDILVEYAETYGVPQKRLVYYAYKWSGRGIAEYGTSIRGMWFELENFYGEYLEMYLQGLQERMGLSE
jgi:hypothetical protein